MPKGIIAVKWDDTRGTVLRAKHPGDLQLTSDEMMRIFTSHAMGEGKAGFMSMKLEAMNVASYYTGLAARGEAQYYIAVILGSDEDAGIFEEPLTETARELLKSIGSKDFQENLAEGYHKLSTYVKLTDEQRLALIQLDPVRKLVFKKLTEGCMSKIELQEWLEQETGSQVADIDLLLVPLIKINVVKKAVVEGVTGECVFLVRDMFAAFIPPEIIMTRVLRGEIKAGLAKSTRGLISEFFRKREPSEEEATQVAEILSNPDFYELISRLRENLTEKEELAKQLGKPAGEVGKLIKSLAKQGIIEEVSDQSGLDLYLLKADPQIQLFFPEYMVDNVRAKWASGEISKEMAVRYLRILRETYLS